MATNRYANGKIYRLVNNVDDEFYVGSTCGKLSKRKNEHKSLTKSKPHIKIYQHLNNIGWENVSIVLIEEYPCENKMELLRRERHWVDELNPSLNKQVPTRTQQQYRDDNKDRIRQRDASYYEKNRTRIIESTTKYRAENIQQINETKKKYVEKNREKLRDYHAKWYAEHKDEWNAKRRAIAAEKRNKQTT
jgi:group I intron endonuclease